MRFPAIEASNLAREPMRLPDDFAGRANILFVAFQQWQQAEVDAWVPLARQLEEELDGVRYYELPTISARGWVGRTVIDGGMRSGIRDPLIRQRTITLYLDKAPFRQALDMPDEEHIYVLLVDGQGKVVWRARGGIIREAGAALQNEIRSILNEMEAG